MNKKSNEDKYYLDLKIGKFNFQTKKNILILMLLFIIFTVLSAGSYAKSVSDDLSSSVFRLHVIANSDSKEDQVLKYKVRDALISYMNTLNIDLSNKDDVVESARKHINEFTEIAENVIAQNGFDYNVNIEIGNFEFPTKTYGDISLPAGFYDALKVKIGKSEGQNWWCVMFPPLCFVDVTSGVVPDESKENLQENLSDEDYDIISENNGITRFKFKIVELFKNFGLRVANK